MDLGVYLVAVVCLLLAFVLYLWNINAILKVEDFKRKFLQDARKNEEERYYDVIVVGAGPAGACCAYFLGQHGRKCVLLERRSKLESTRSCGGVITSRGVRLLQQIGVYQSLMKDAQAATGINRIGIVDADDVKYTYVTSGTQRPTLTVFQRPQLDAAIASHAESVGVELRTDAEVVTAELDKGRGLWTIRLHGSTAVFRSRLLVCADGAGSSLASKLGIVRTSGGCTRSTCVTLVADTEDTPSDCMLYLHKQLLPGYGFMCSKPGHKVQHYFNMVPGSPGVNDTELEDIDKSYHQDLHLINALGSKYTIDNISTSPTRAGLVPRMFGDHVLVIGEASGMVDPLTGLGIDTCLEAGKMAADFLEEAMHHGNYDSVVMEIYQLRFQRKFGHIFKWSWVMSEIIRQYPVVIDALTMTLQRKDGAYFEKWMNAITGNASRLQLLQPSVWLPVLHDVLHILATRLISYVNPIKSNSAKLL